MLILLFSSIAVIAYLLLNTICTFHYTFVSAQGNTNLVYKIISFSFALAME